MRSKNTGEGKFIAQRQPGAKFSPKWLASILPLNLFFCTKYLSCMPVYSLKTCLTLSNIY